MDVDPEPTAEEGLPPRRRWAEELDRQMEEVRRLVEMQSVAAQRAAGEAHAAVRRVEAQLREMERRAEGARPRRPQLKLTLTQTRSVAAAAAEVPELDTEGDVTMQHGREDQPETGRELMMVEAEIPAAAPLVVGRVRGALVDVLKRAKLGSADLPTLSVRRRGLEHGRGLAVEVVGERRAVEPLVRVLRGSEAALERYVETVAEERPEASERLEKKNAAAAISTTTTSRKPTTTTKADRDTEAKGAPGGGDGGGSPVRTEQQVAAECGLYACRHGWASCGCPPELLPTWADLECAAGRVSRRDQEAAAGAVQHERRCAEQVPPVERHSSPSGDFSADAMSEALQAFAPACVVQRANVPRTEGQVALFAVRHLPGRSDHRDGHWVALCREAGAADAFVEIDSYGKGSRRPVQPEEFTALDANTLIVTCSRRWREALSELEEPERFELAERCGAPGAGTVEECDRVIAEWHARRIPAVEAFGESSCWARTQTREGRAPGKAAPPGGGAGRAARGRAAEVIRNRGRAASLGRLRGTGRGSSEWVYVPGEDRGGRRRPGGQPVPPTAGQLAAVRRSEARRNTLSEMRAQERGAGLPPCWKTAAVLRRWVAGTLLREVCEWSERRGGAAEAAEPRAAGTPPTTPPAAKPPRMAPSPEKLGPSSQEAAAVEGRSVGDRCVTVWAPAGAPAEWLTATASQFRLYVERAGLRAVKVRFEFDGMEGATWVPRKAIQEGRLEWIPQGLSPPPVRGRKRGKRDGNAVPKMRGGAEGDGEAVHPPAGGSRGMAVRGANMRAVRDPRAGVHGV